MTVLPLTCSTFLFPSLLIVAIVQRGPRKEKKSSQVRMIYKQPTRSNGSHSSSDMFFTPGIGVSPEGSFSKESVMPSMTFSKTIHVSGERSMLRLALQMTSKVFLQRSMWRCIRGAKVSLTVFVAEVCCGCCGV